MFELLLGTRNAGKINEIRHLLRNMEGLRLLTLEDRTFGEIEETGSTFIENALLKVNGIADATGLAVLAEDAGLEVAALDGAPGVRSARFAGEPVDHDRNNDLLLERLEGMRDRSARFIAVAVLRLSKGEIFVTTGTLPGHIALEPAGTEGFGYDPVFIPSIPETETRTLAQMSLDEKGRISHRMQALRRMRPILLDLIAS